MADAVRGNYSGDMQRSFEELGELKGIVSKNGLQKRVESIEERLERVQMLLTGSLVTAIIATLGVIANLVVQLASK